MSTFRGELQTAWPAFWWRRCGGVAVVAMNLLWWALPMLLAFSAGLAAVLVAIGILVVRTKALAGKR